MRELGDSDIDYYNEVLLFVLKDLQDSNYQRIDREKKTKPTELSKWFTVKNKNGTKQCDLCSRLAPDVGCNFKYSGDERFLNHLIRFEPIIGKHIVLSETEHNDLQPVSASPSPQLVSAVSENSEKFPIFFKFEIVQVKSDNNCGPRALAFPEHDSDEYKKIKAEVVKGLIDYKDKLAYPVDSDLLQFMRKNCSQIIEAFSNKKKPTDEELADLTELKEFYSKIRNADFSNYPAQQHLHIVILFQIYRSADYESY